MIYTKAAAARILGISPSSIIKLTPARGSYAVSYKTGRNKKGCTFIGKKAFRQEFADFRRAGAAKVEVYSHDGTWIATGSTDDYEVDLFTEPQPVCGCQDFHNQVEAGLPRQCCKHIYAVLNVFGHQSLSDWIERVSVPHFCPVPVAAPF